MCRAWNRPGYQELERLVPELRVGAPRGYRAFVGIYVYPRQVRRALCPKCGHVAPPAMIGELHRHRHGKRAGACVARMLRVPLFPVPEADVEELVDSMCDNWRGEPFVPDDLLPLVAVA